MRFSNDSGNVEYNLFDSGTGKRGKVDRQYGKIGLNRRTIHNFKIYPIIT